MQLILLEKIGKLGNLGDVVNVRPGYGRNYLLPKGLAKVATPENLKEFEARRAELERISAEHLRAAQSVADALNEKNVTVAAKAGGEGKLFGSVSAADISAAIKDQLQLDVDRKALRLDSIGLRHTGDHTVGAHLHADVDAEFTVTVVAEE